MFFNGLLKRYPSIAHDKRYNTFCETLMPSQHGKPTSSAAYKFISGAQWSLLIQRFGFEAKGLALPRLLSPAESDATEGMIQLVHDAVFDVPHRCFFLQLISAAPGGDVSRHRDLRQFFSFTRRFNVILATNPQAYVSTFHMQDGIEVETKHRDPLGTLYELNNRIPHAAKNDGQTLLTVAVLDFVPADYPPFTVDDWETSIINRRCDLHAQINSSFTASISATTSFDQL